jgi:class 3 adenylate cyclase
MPPRTRYARSGDVNIAFQVFGDAPRDLVLVVGWVTNIDLLWEEPRCARWLQRLATFSRVILLDKRGVGLSDRVPADNLPSLEVRMDDIRAVMDAAGSERAAVYGLSDSGALCSLFAATYPERTTALVLQGCVPRRMWAPDYPWGFTDAQGASLLESIERVWGGPVRLAALAPTMVSDQPFSEWWARYLRQGGSPATAVAFQRMNFEIDVRHVLPAIRVPTLIMQRTGEGGGRMDEARYLAGQIPGAKLVELPGIDHLAWVGESVEMSVDEIQELLTGVRQAAEPDRVLATVLFTDIDGSTERAAQLGDRRWLDMLAQHDTTVRQELARFRGREVKTTGDGFLATFDGPARAVRCASAIVQAVRPLGLEVRAGLHTGECELLGDDVGGIAVHIGQRVSALAGPSEVLASSTVRDLVAGSGLAFEPRGEHVLRGLPDQWRIFAVVGA